MKWYHNWPCVWSKYVRSNYITGTTPSTKLPTIVTIIISIGRELLLEELFRLPFKIKCAIPSIICIGYHMFEHDWLTVNFIHFAHDMWTFSICGKRVLAIFKILFLFFLNVVTILLVLQWNPQQKSENENENENGNENVAE